jgi:hypothetical protein
MTATKIEIDYMTMVTSSEITLATPIDETPIRQMQEQFPDVRFDIGRYVTLRNIRIYDTNAATLTAAWGHWLISTTNEGSHGGFRESGETLPEAVAKMTAALTANKNRDCPTCGRMYPIGRPNDRT